MAVAYRSSGTIVANGDAGVNMQSVQPAGLTIGDIMIFEGLDADNEHFEAGLPLGWEPIHSDNATGNAGYTVAWKRYDNLQEVFDFDTPSNAGSVVMGVIHAYSGCIKTGTPFSGAVESVVANQKLLLNILRH